MACLEKRKDLGRNSGCKKAERVGVNEGVESRDVVFCMHAAEIHGVPSDGRG